MKGNVKKWYIIGTIFIILFGTLLHFVYEWSGNNAVVGIFAPVNESTWEHLKLLFWPALIFSIVEYIFLEKDYNNYITAKAASFYIGILLIISLFYTYTGIIGENFLFMDIAIFIISVIISQYIGYQIMTADKDVSKTINYISLISIMLLIFVFVIFTFDPPRLPLFQDPITGNYGI